MKFPVSTFSADTAQDVALPDLERLGVPASTVRKIACIRIMPSNPVAEVATREVRK